MDRFEGHIAGIGTTSGTRLVIGRWDTSPFGSFTDVMLEDAAGRRTLLAPGQEKQDALFRPVERRGQLASVLHSDSGRVARPGICEPPRPVRQAQGRSLHRSGDLGKRGADGRDGGKLGFPDGGRNAARGPGVEVLKPGIDGFGHGLSWAPGGTAGS